MVGALHQILEGSLQSFRAIDIAGDHRKNRGTVTYTMRSLRYQPSLPPTPSPTFLSDARQPEVRPSLFLYALTLTNLYCQVSFFL